MIIILSCFQQHTIHAALVSSVARMDVAFSQHGSVIMKMTVVMVQMKKVVNIPHVLMESLHVQITDAYHRHRFVFGF